MSEVFKGAIDFHIHIPPDLVPRKVDAYELAKQCKDIGMSGVLVKDHHGETTGQSDTVNRLIKDFKVYGSLVLNYPVGGLNPFAVEASIGKNARLVYMPTIAAANHIAQRGIGSKFINLFPADKRGITIFDEKGKIVDAVEEILRIIAKANVVLATGHLSLKEVIPLVKSAKKAGVEKIAITHPTSTINYIPPSEQQWLAKQGAYLEFCYWICKKNNESFYDTAQNIKHIGPQHCILGTDLGQPDNSLPSEGMKVFFSGMQATGLFTDAELRMMVRDNALGLLE